MVKRAIILISLIEDCSQRKDRDLEKEIFESLSPVMPKILPLCRKVEKVRIREKRW